MDRNYNKSSNSGERKTYRPAGERGSFRPRTSGGHSERPERAGKPGEYRDRGERYSKPSGERNFNRDDRGSRGYSSGDNRPERREYQGSRDEHRSFRPTDSRGADSRGERSFNRPDSGSRNYSSNERRPERREYQGNRDEHRSFRPTDNRGTDNRGERSFNRTDNGNRNYSSGERRPERREYQGDRDERRGGYRENNAGREDNGVKKIVRKERSSERDNYYNRDRKEIGDTEKEELRQRHYSKKKILAHRLKNETAETELRLNRYISMGGICSRRDADELIKTGRVKVNGEVVQTVGVKVRKKDKVEVDGGEITPERKVYLVLNKPKDYVTTVDDPMERKTVMSLVQGACKERVYPIGRLDRQTTGVLLFTNDGDLAKKLTHPKYDHKKIYHVFLDKAVSDKDLQAIADGVKLEDGFIQADEISFASDDRTEVGIEIHSGKNRIVRRIFEHFGYQIMKLDRVYFAGITKKNVPRGTWRFLTTEEINVLKFY